MTENVKKKLSKIVDLNFKKNKLFVISPKKISFYKTLLTGTQLAAI